MPFGWANSISAFCGLVRDAHDDPMDRLVAVMIAAKPWDRLVHLKALFLRLREHERKVAGGKYGHSLLPKHEGPFGVVSRLGEFTYGLRCSPQLDRHWIFYVNFMRKFTKDSDCPKRQQALRAAPEAEHPFGDGKRRRTGQSRVDDGSQLPTRTSDFSGGGGLLRP